MQFHEVTDAIVGGLFDDDLDLLIDAVRDRRKQLAKRNLNLFKPDDRVRVVGNISPKYLLGATGVVVGRRGNHIDVKLNERVGRYGEIVPVGFPPACLELIAS